MKYLIVVTDGAGDRPLDSIGGLTALQKADMRYINELAKTGVIGTVKTVLDNMPPGSDVANLSVMGYDPAIYQKVAKCFFSSTSIPTTWALRPVASRQSW